MISYFELAVIFLILTPRRPLVAPNAFNKPKVFEQCPKLVEPDVGVGAAAQDAIQYLRDLAHGPPILRPRSARSDPVVVPGCLALPRMGTSSRLFSTSRDRLPQVSLHEPFQGNGCHRFPGIVRLEDVAHRTRSRPGLLPSCGGGFID